MSGETHRGMYYPRPSSVWWRRGGLGLVVSVDKRPFRLLTSRHATMMTYSTPLSGRPGPPAVLAERHEQ